MVRILALLLALWSGPALAQAEFSTIISPTTLGTSPLAVTFGSSPFGIVCVSGCGSAGASPSSVIVTNQPTVTASLSGSPFVYQGTAAWQVNIIGGSTIPVSANGPLFVQQGTSPWAIAGGVNVNNTVTTSLSTSAPFVQQGTNPWTITPSPSPMAVIQTSGFTNVTSPLAVTLPVSPITVGTLTSGAIVNVMAAGTSPLAVIPTTSPLAVTLPLSPITVAAVNSAAVTVNMAAGTSPIAVGPVTDSNIGTGYVSNAVWKSASLSSSTTGNQVLMNAPAANKLYITGIQCSRTDAGTTAIMLAFNATLGNGTSVYIVIPNSGGGGGNNQTYSPPLTVAATTSLQFTPTASVNTLFCNAQGYNAP